MSSYSEDELNKMIKVNTSETVRILQSQLSSLMNCEDTGISAFPNNFDLFDWTGSITGPPGTAYEGLTYKLSIKFPPAYPYYAPTVTFTTNCFHPNVDKFGNICVDILRDNWSPMFNVRIILLSIQMLLESPNNDSPLNGYAANLWEDYDNYKKEVTRFYNS